MLNYKLALDLGTKSIGWAVIRLNKDGAPNAIVKTGVRIFSDSLTAEGKTSLAAVRRAARQARRTGDRLIRRKRKLIYTLVELGFFPSDKRERKQLERLDPYQLRAKGVTQELSPSEFARAVFHLNRKRGFKSNRLSESDDDVNSAKPRLAAIAEVREALVAKGFETVGQWLCCRNQEAKSVRSRARDSKGEITSKSIEIKNYDLFITREMMQHEFDTIWQTQQKFNPALYNEQSKQLIAECIFSQRPLKPVNPGACTFFSNEPRARLALPSQQQFRIYQELNNLRPMAGAFKVGDALTKSQRDLLAASLEKGSLSLTKKAQKILGLSESVKFNLQTDKKESILANKTSVALSKKHRFGKAWLDMPLEQQDQIVLKILTTESKADFVRWLQAEVKDISDQAASEIYDVDLPKGYGKLSKKAIDLILPELKKKVQTYDKAAKAVGLNHSEFGITEEIPGRTFAIEHTVKSTGEVKTYHVLKSLPYYGEFLRRYTGLVDLSASEGEIDEKRFGRIANPTVHVALNQVRLVVNSIIAKYGHPTAVTIEVARDLKIGKKQKAEIIKAQAKNQERNKAIRGLISKTLGIEPNYVTRKDIQKVMLWEDLHKDVNARCCPYSGEKLSISRVLSAEVEVDHILPFSKTLSDRLVNKVVCIARANRIKSDRSPWQAKEDFERMGWHYSDIEKRALNFINKARAKKFAADAMSSWERTEGKNFISRALTDTQYISRVAAQYLALICPTNTQVTPGALTAVLRRQFGLNTILGRDGKKNRDDHRHHAIDACVIGVVDRSLLQQASIASARAEVKGFDGVARLLSNLAAPWPSYRDQVQHSIDTLNVSHKPEHDYKGQIHEATALGIKDNGEIKIQHKPNKTTKGRRILNESTITISDPKRNERHGLTETGEPKPYKAYKKGNNYCIEIVLNEDGKWAGEVISTYQAYQIAKTHGEQRLFDPGLSISGKPLVMRIRKKDCLSIIHDGRERLVAVAGITTRAKVNSITLTMDEIHEANGSERERARRKAATSSIDSYKRIKKTPATLQKAGAKYITISPIGKVNYRAARK